LLIDDENSMGVEKRRELEHLIMEGKMTYRDAVYQMWDAVGLTLEEAWDKHLNRKVAVIDIKKRLRVLIVCAF
jgi:2-hydroxy-3-keto-5-methylthiopentenyl-1-phosphate phosphatase